jgi:hypothetical protein
MADMQRISRFRGAGRYRLLDLLSLDDLGSVWAAEDSARRQRVTVRLISRQLAEDPRFVDRLREEVGGGLSRLSHPNVASVLDLSAEARGALYVVMEPMHGQTLAQRLRTGGPLGKMQAKRIASCLADALHAAHRAGIEHGPVAPENVMLTAEGHVKLMDFGVVPASRDSRTRSRRGADASGDSPLRPHPWVPSRELESIDQLMVLMLSSSSPDDEREPSRKHQVRRTLDVSVFPPELLFDTNSRSRDLQPSAAMGGRARGDTAARATAPQRVAVRVGRALKMIVLRTGGALKGTALRTGWALKRTGIGAGRALRRTGLFPWRAFRAAGIRVDRARRAVIGHLGPVLAAAGIAAVAVVIVGALALNGGQATDGPPLLRDGERQGAGEPPPAPSSVTGGVEVPNLFGLSAFQAQARLHRLGLQYGAVVPTPGSPGKVVMTAPQPGVKVSRGTEITLFIGTRSDRVEGSSTPG